jgi:hypothetical protein
MNNLGSQEIIFENYVNGRLDSSKTLNRTVLERPDGSFFIRELRGSTEVKKRKGKYYVRIDYSNIKTTKEVFKFSDYGGTRGKRT